MATVERYSKRDNTWEPVKETDDRDEAETYAADQAHTTGRRYRVN